MNIKKHIPNFLTCCNLLCGCLGIFSLSSHLDNSLSYASYLIFIACVFDFLDGFVARLLKVTSPIGKELDSLADVVTFGVLPSFIILDMLTHTLEQDTFSLFLPLVSFLIAVFSALRLAKFNIDTRQSESFIGVPTPANGILIASLPLIVDHSDSLLILEIIINPVFLIGLTIVMSFLLVAPLPLFALKFKDFTWTNNKMRYIFLVMSIVLLSTLYFLAIPLIIFLYIVLSFIEKIFIKKSSVKEAY